MCTAHISGTEFVSENELNADKKATVTGRYLLNLVQR